MLICQYSISHLSFYSATHIPKCELVSSSISFYIFPAIVLSLFILGSTTTAHRIEQLYYCHLILYWWSPLSPLLLPPRRKLSSLVPGHPRQSQTFAASCAQMISHQYFSASFGSLQMPLNLFVTSFFSSLLSSSSSLSLSSLLLAFCSSYYYYCWDTDERIRWIKYIYTYIWTSSSLCSPYHLRRRYHLSWWTEDTPSSLHLCWLQYQPVRRKKRSTMTMIPHSDIAAVVELLVYVFYVHWFCWYTKTKKNQPNHITLCHWLINN